LQPSDYEKLMKANLASVFNERDAEKRLVAIGELYAQDAVLNEPERSVAGHAEISDTVTALLADFPPDFVFTATAPAVGHHGIGYLRWRAGSPAGPAIFTGMDIAHFKDGVITALYVFIEPSP
jgi:hypothetical protein